MLISIENTKRKPGTEETKNIHNELPEKTNHTLKTEKLCHDPSLTLATLSKKLHTNRENFSFTINHCFGLSYTGYTNKHSFKTAVEIPGNNSTAPRGKSFIPWNNCFAPLNNSFPLRSNSYIPRSNSFPLRDNSFTPLNKSFPLRDNSFIPWNKSFPLRDNSIIPDNKTLFLWDKPQLHKNIFPIHIPPFIELPPRQAYIKTPS